MTPDGIGTIVAVFGAAATLFGGMVALNARMMHRIDPRFEQVDARFERIENELVDQTGDRPHGVPQLAPHRLLAGSSC